MSIRSNTRQALEHLKFGIQSSLDYPMSQLDIWIAQACDPLHNTSPNLSLNLEICDLINKNLKTYPRDAAFAIVKQVNYSSSSASLALSLLDHCAKNCGYPFHLVMSSKEFLNELVRKFPESPKHITGTQRKILDLIAEWNVTYASSSRYKEDFKHINDMYRLLEFKGYRFPQIKESASSNFQPDVNLKTEEQLEREDRVNNGVKLEELIRKGTPAALAEANEMMKLMSGYDTSKKPDYKKEVNNELERIESKVILLNDMLNQKTHEDLKRRKDATIEELHSSSKLAQTRLQKFIEENEDEDRLHRLLEMNDMINTVLQKYSDLKNGKEVQRNNLDRTQRAAQAGEGGSPVKPDDEKAFINLIDFDNIGSTSVNHSPQLLNQNTIFDPFASVTTPPTNNFNSIPSHQQQQHHSPQYTNQAPVNTTISNNNNNLLGDFGGLNFGNPQQPQFQPQQQAQFQQPHLQQQHQQNHQPILNPNFQGSMGQQPALGFQQQQPIFNTNNSSSNFQGLIPQTQLQQNKPVSLSQKPAAPQPFDDLFGSIAPIAAKPIAAAMPMAAARSSPAPAANQNDLLGLFNESAQKQSSNFQTSSNVPVIAKENIIFSKNGLQIKMTLPSPSNLPQFSGNALFLNITPVTFTNLNFQLSLPKSMNVQLDPMSTTTLAPFNQSPASQKFLVSNPAKESLRMRFKVEYNMNGAIVSELGEFAAN